MNDIPAASIIAWGVVGTGIVTAFFGGIVSIITLFKVGKVEAHVNSDKTRMEGEIAKRDIKIALLEQMMTEHKQAAALLAQAASHPIRSGPRADDPIVVAPAAVLEKIETNTAATAEGVQNLKDTMK